MADEGRPAERPEKRKNPVGYALGPRLPSTQPYLLSARKLTFKSARRGWKLARTPANVKPPLATDLAPPSVPVQPGQRFARFLRGPGSCSAHAARGADVTFGVPSGGSLATLPGPAGTTGGMAWPPPAATSSTHPQSCGEQRLQHRARFFST